MEFPFPLFGEPHAYFLCHLSHCNFVSDTLPLISELLKVRNNSFIISVFPGSSLVYIVRAQYMSVWGKKEKKDEERKLRRFGALENNFHDRSWKLSSHGDLEYMYSDLFFSKWRSWSPLAGCSKPSLPSTDLSLGFAKVFSSRKGWQ